MLADKLIPLQIRSGTARFDFLGAHDEPWLRALIGELERFHGRRQRELDQRLQGPLPCASPWAKRQAATVVLAKIWRESEAAPRSVDSRRVRSEVFRASAAVHAAREEVLERTAQQLDLTAEALEQALFADLPSERIVRTPPVVPSPYELGLRVNLALAQAALQRASAIRIRVDDQLRQVVRLAKLRGLICTVDESSADGRPWLNISGPFALFRHTLLYGRALGELVPVLARSQTFELRATCMLRGQCLELSLESGAPLFTAPSPRVFDSRLEERFARDFGSTCPDWDLYREPRAIRAGDGLIFPDFELRHRVDPSRAWLVEIAGFWTAEYVARKLASLRIAKISNLILCIDEERECSGADLPPDARVVRFRRRVDVGAVVRIIGGERPAAGQHARPEEG